MTALWGRLQCWLDLHDWTVVYPHPKSSCFLQLQRCRRCKAIR